MRDLSRATGMSLAGLYYYFDSKEKLLYLIQKHTFTTIVTRLRERLKDVSDPEERVRVCIHNHLEYFLANQKAMKVLSHEDEVLKNHYGAEIAGIKREYYRICVELLDALKHGHGIEFSTRTAVLSLFGMQTKLINPDSTFLISPLHNPDVDPKQVEMYNPMLNNILHPKNFSWKGKYLFDSTDNLIGFITVASQNILLCFNKEGHWTCYFVRTPKGTYNQFQLTGEWTGRFLCPDSLEGFNMFTKEGVWTGNHVK